MSIDYINDQDVARLVTYAELADAIDAAFAAGAEAPLRHHYQVEVPHSAPGHWMLMPSWQTGAAMGIKLVSFFPGNAQRGQPTVNAGFLLLDGNTGIPRAYLDGNQLTLRRTAAASLLAGRYLARPESSRMLLVGTGQLAEHMARAHASEFPIERLQVWGRSADKTRAMVETLQDLPCSVEPANNLEMAVRSADIVSCATSTSEPLIRGAWLRPGQHLDLVGAFTGEMREADDEAMQCTRIYADTLDGTFAESGELIQAMANGAIEAGDVVAEMAQLARGECTGRGSNQEITLFKSVGCALEDLAAAQLVVSKRALSQGCS